MNVVIPLSPKQCALVLAFITTLLVVASLGATLLSFTAVADPFLREVRESVIRLAWLDGEGNLPAWYSACLLLLCSILLTAIASAERQRQSRYAVGWLVLALIFLFLSLDETAQLHELSIAPLQDTFSASGFLLYAWIVPAGICVALFVLGYWRFLVNLPPRTRRLFLLAGALFVGGALAVESVSGQEVSLHGEQTLTYHLIVTLEESFEMGGIVLFIYALLDYIGDQFTTVSFHVTNRQ
jgi:hypothetical protein